MKFGRGLRRVAWAFTMSWAGGRASAQQQPAPIRCNGQRIDSIRVSASAPTVAALRKIPVIARVVRQ